jgi:hypothetical protein
VLLAADPDRFDLAASLSDVVEAFGDGLAGGFCPGFRLLFDMLRRQALGRPVVALCEGDELAGFDIEH